MIILLIFVTVNINFLFLINQSCATNFGDIHIVIATKVNFNNYNSKNELNVKKKQTCYERNSLSNKHLIFYNKINKT